MPNPRQRRRIGQKGTRAALARVCLANCKLARNSVVSGLMRTICLCAIPNANRSLRRDSPLRQVASFDFDNFHDFFVISTFTSALGTEIDVDVVHTSGSGSY